MNKLWTIARKDIRDSFRSRSTYIYIVILCFLTMTYFSTYSTLVNRVIEQNSGQEAVRQISQVFLNSMVYALPLMYSILICAIFAAYSVIVEKSRRNLESLLATPVSLSKIWMGKTLAVTLPSIIIALGVTILGYIAINIFQVMPRTGSFIVPDVLPVVTAIVIVPLLLFAVVSLVIYLQLVISNPRIANLAFTAIFLLLYFGANIFSQMGVAIDFGYIYLGIAAVCGGFSFFLSRSLTKEKVVLSSKA